MHTNLNYHNTSYHNEDINTEEYLLVLVWLYTCLDDLFFGGHTNHFCYGISCDNVDMDAALSMRVVGCECMHSHSFCVLSNVS